MVGGTMFLCVAMAGCHHQPQVAPLPAKAQTPSIYLPPPPQPNLPPMEAPPPREITELKSSDRPRVKQKKHVHKPAAQGTKSEEPQAPPPASMPAAVAPADTGVGAATAALGALSAGGTSSPQQQQAASNHIAAVTRRLQELPAQRADAQQKQVSQVRQFLKQAEDALKTGDAEGADNLATKAGLLLDDLTQ
jgi:uncharacterized protein HemX